LALAATIDLAGGAIFLLACAGWVATVPVLRRRIGWGLLGVSVPALLHAALNWRLTGDVIPLLIRPEYLKFPGSTLPLEELSGIANHASVASIGHYLVGLLWGTSMDPHGPRGLFLYSPALFASCVATIKLWARGEHPLHLAAVYLGGACVAFVLYLAVFTNNYAGVCYGVRWFVLVLPTAYVLLFGGWDRLSLGERWCAGIALAVSVPIAFAGVILGAWQADRAVPWLAIQRAALPVLFAALIGFTSWAWQRERRTRA
jgi:hypothetical protein